MNESRRLWMQALAAGSAGLSAGTVLAQAEPAAGRDFRAVNPAQPVEAPAGKIEVLEFFAYWCPHCASLEPELADWKKRQPPEIVFRREHVSFRETRIQQMHYALVALGKADELSPRVFQAIHVDKVRLETPQKNGRGAGARRQAVFRSLRIVFGSHPGAARHPDFRGLCDRWRAFVRGGG